MTALVFIQLLLSCEPFCCDIPLLPNLLFFLPQRKMQECGNVSIDCTTDRNGNPLTPWLNVCITWPLGNEDKALNIIVLTNKTQQVLRSITICSYYVLHQEKENDLFPTDPHFKINKLMVICLSLIQLVYFCHLSKSYNIKSTAHTG